MGVSQNSGTLIGAPTIGKILFGTYIGDPCFGKLPDVGCSWAGEAPSDGLGHVFGWCTNGSLATVVSAAQRVRLGGDATYFLGTWDPKPYVPTYILMHPYPSLSRLVWVLRTIKTLNPSTLNPSNLGFRVLQGVLWEVLAQLLALWFSQQHSLEESFCVGV